MTAWLESAQFARDLHLLLKAGMSVPEALDRLQKKARGPWATAIGKAKEATASGSTLPQALRQTGTFPQLLVDGLEVGEGDLPLLKLSQLLERLAWRQRQTNTVLAYPFLLLVGGLALLALLCSTVGLAVRSLYLDMSMQLPALTQIVFGIVRLLTNPLVIALILAAVAGLGWVLAGTASSAGWRLRLPLVGSWVRRSQAAIWLDWIDYYLEAGLSVPQALRHASVACFDPAFRERALGAATAAEQGQDLHQAISGQGLLSELGLWLVARGQALEFPRHYLQRVAAILHRELESESEGGLACLEVVGILLVGMLVLPMVLSFFLPLYQLIGTIGE